MPSPITWTISLQDRVFEPINLGPLAEEVYREHLIEDVLPERLAELRGEAFCGRACTEMCRAIFEVLGWQALWETRVSRPGVLYLYVVGASDEEAQLLERVLDELVPAGLQLVVVPRGEDPRRSRRVDFGPLSASVKEPVDTFPDELRRSVWDRLLDD